MGAVQGLQKFQGPFVGPIFGGWGPTWPQGLNVGVGVRFWLLREGLIICLVAVIAFCLSLWPGPRTHRESKNPS